MEAETCKKELVIEIPAEVIRRETETVTTQYQRLARIPGFRRGKAPASLVRRHFHDDIRNEIVQSLVPKYFEDAIKDKKMSVVGRPRFLDLQFKDDQPITCKAAFEVLPEFELKNYKGLEVKEGSVEVTDADVDQALEDIRQRAATFEVVEGRAAEDGDYLLVNYQGQDSNDTSAAPVEAHDATVHVGGQGTVPAFTENLRGAKAGEKRDFDVTYPEDYPEKSLAGKTFHYRIEVTSVKKKVVPALDDELAKSASEFQTLEELKAELRENLAARKKHQIEVEAKRKLLDGLVEAHSFPVPEILVEAQLDGKLEKIVGQLLAQGIDPRTIGVDWRKIREDSRADAEKEVRSSLVLESVADAEKIEVSEDELDELIRDLARERHEAPAALKTHLTRDGGLDRIKSTRRNQKTLDFIYRTANVMREQVS